MGQLLDDQRVGAVKLDGRWRLFGAPLVFFALDAVSFCGAGADFRAGLPQIDEANAPQFMAAMEPYELQPEDIRRLCEAAPFPPPLFFVIDFDAKMFVDGWTGDNLEDHVPGGWTGVADEPFKYVPAEVRELWTP